MLAQPPQIAAATRLFTPGVLTKLAKTGDFREFSALWARTGFLSETTTPQTVGEAFDAAFGLLKTCGARSEYVYKAALTHNVLLGVHSLATASLVSEFRAGSSKADVVIFNGTSTVYEIKSERDNLDRLVGQISDYRKVFAHVNVICAPMHAKSVERIIPEDVGILTLTRWNRITTVRGACDRAAELCPTAILSSLTNAEAKTILKRCGVDVPMVPNTRLRRELSSLFVKLDPAILHANMVSTLKNTRSALSLKSVLHNFPKSVMPAVMNLRLKQAEKERLMEVMQKPLSSL